MSLLDRQAAKLLNQGGLATARIALAACREAGVKDADVRKEWLRIGVKPSIVDAALEEKKE